MFWPQGCAQAVPPLTGVAARDCKMLCKGNRGQSLVGFPPAMPIYMQSVEMCQACPCRTSCSFLQPSGRWGRNVPLDPARVWWSSEGAPHSALLSQPGRGHWPRAERAQHGVKWAVPREEDAEGQLGRLYKALLFPGRVGGRETVPVGCLFSLCIRKAFFSPFFILPNALWVCLRVIPGIPSPL